MLHKIDVLRSTVTSISEDHLSLQNINECTLDQNLQIHILNQCKCSQNIQNLKGGEATSSLLDLLKEKKYKLVAESQPSLDRKTFVGLLCDSNP